MLTNEYDENSVEYPLGGSVSVYDIEIEQQLIEKLELELELELEKEKNKS